MFPAVWTRLASGRYRCARATLPGFRRQRVLGQDYPSLERATGQAGAATVDGILYFDVSADDLARLDAFEGPDYRRIGVSAILREQVAGGPEAGTSVAAETYLFIATAKVEPGDWDPDEFARDRIGRFLRDYPPPGGR